MIDNAFATRDLEERAALVDDLPCGHADPLAQPIRAHSIASHPKCAEMLSRFLTSSRIPFLRKQ
ncbi:hypothetical protein [Imbroritus primus]|uniref:hypothetical protein n=1 Tax=Imbroritus primus TaxID=3058603 RepID=UPI003D160403